MDYVNYNGKLIPATQPIFTSKNRSFRYGDGLFESIRLLNWIMPMFEDHINRLFKGMNTLQLELSTRFSKLLIKKLILELAKKNNTAGNARIRLIVFRTGGETYDPSDNKASLVIECSKIEQSQYILNNKGFEVDVFEKTVVKQIDRLSNLKTNNSLPYILASLFKDNNGLDDSIILNNYGRVVEATSSNVFIVKDGTLLTPALSEGCVAGVMRKNIIHLAKKNEIEVLENKLTIENILAAKEFFLTNAINGIRWVEKFRKQRYTKDIPLLLTQQINKA